MLRVVFFGTPMFAVPALRAILASPHQVVAVVTQPDRRRGRGQHLADSPVKQAARESGLPVLQPERLKEESWLAAFGALRADIGVVAAYGKLLPQALLDIPAHGFVNVHASLLPRYRGASPIQRAVINGDAETGVTIMRIVLALDAGPMFSRGTVAIGPDDTSQDVETALASLGGTLIVQTLDAIDGGTATETAQDDAAATYAPRLTKNDGLLDWRLSAHDIHNRVRGLRPWPEAFSLLNGARFVVVRGVVDADPADAVQPGTVLEAKGDRLIVAAGGATTYRLLDVQPEGRRVMSAREFLAGRSISPGAVLSGLP